VTRYTGGGRRGLLFLEAFHMRVQAKMRCVSKSDTCGNYGPPGVPTQAFVKLSAVQGEENKTWTQWTPSGSAEMQITNPAALAAFEVGKDYLVTFEAAPEVAPA
jgi:hypothetical protein